MIKTGRISPGPALAAGSFLILYVGLAWFNRLSRDDFALLELVKSRGILHATWLFYSDWNGRWIALLQSHTWLAFYNRYTLLLFAIRLLCRAAFLHIREGGIFADCARRIQCPETALQHFHRYIAKFLA